MLQLKIVVIVVAFGAVVGGQAIDNGVYDGVCGCDKLNRLESGSEKLGSLVRVEDQETVNAECTESAYNATSRGEDDDEVYISGGWFRMGLER